MMSILGVGSESLTQIEMKMRDNWFDGVAGYHVSLTSLDDH